MIVEAPAWYGTVVLVVELMLAASLIMAFVRLVRGPSLPDRVVALDLIGVLVVAAIAVYAIETGQSIFVEVAIVLALLAFLGTVAFAQYVERRGAR